MQVKLKLNGVEQAMRQLQPAVERMVAVVEQHGGTIAAAFPPDGGTQLIVTLPAQVSLSS